MEFWSTAGAQAKPGVGSILCRFRSNASAASDGSKRTTASAERQPGGAAGGLQSTSICLALLVLQPDPECDIGQLRIDADEARKAFFGGSYFLEFVYLGQIHGYGLGHAGRRQRAVYSARLRLQAGLRTFGI